MTNISRDHLVEICHISKEQKGDRTLLKCNTCGWQWIGHFMQASAEQGAHMKEHADAE